MEMDMIKDTVTIEVPAGSTVLVNGKEVDTRTGFLGKILVESKPEFISRFKHGEYVLYSDGEVRHHPVNSSLDLHRLQGSTYITRADGKKEAKRKELETRWLTRIAQLNYEHDWVCDWEDVHQFKSFVNSFCHKRFRVVINTNRYIQHRSTEHYFCPGAKDKLLSEFTDDEIKTIYFGEIG